MYGDIVHLLKFYDFPRKNALGRTGAQFRIYIFSTLSRSPRQVVFPVYFKRFVPYVFVHH